MSKPSSNIGNLLTGKQKKLGHYTLSETVDGDWMALYRGEMVGLIPEKKFNTDLEQKISSSPAPVKQGNYWQSSLDTLNGNGMTISSNPADRTFVALPHDDARLNQHFLGQEPSKLEKATQLANKFQFPFGFQDPLQGTSATDWVLNRYDEKTSKDESAKYGSWNVPGGLHHASGVAKAFKNIIKSPGAIRHEAGKIGRGVQEVLAHKVGDKTKQIPGKMDLNSSDTVSPYYTDDGSIGYPDPTTIKFDTILPAETTNVVMSSPKFNYGGVNPSAINSALAFQQEYLDNRFDLREFMESAQKRDEFKGSQVTYLDRIKSKDTGKTLYERPGLFSDDPYYTPDQIRIDPGTGEFLSFEELPGWGMKNTQPVEYPQHMTEADYIERLGEFQGSKEFQDHLRENFELSDILTGLETYPSNNPYKKYGGDKRTFKTRCPIVKNNALTRMESDASRKGFKCGGTMKKKLKKGGEHVPFEPGPDFYNRKLQGFTNNIRGTAGANIFYEDDMQTAQNGRPIGLPPGYWVGPNGDLMYGDLKVGNYDANGNLTSSGRKPPNFNQVPKNLSRQYIQELASRSPQNNISPQAQFNDPRFVPPVGLEGLPPDSIPSTPYGYVSPYLSDTTNYDPLTQRPINEYGDIMNLDEGWMPPSEIPYNYNNPNNLPPGYWLTPDAKLMYSEGNDTPQEIGQYDRNTGKLNTKTGRTKDAQGVSKKPPGFNQIPQTLTKGQLERVQRRGEYMVTPHGRETEKFSSYPAPTISEIRGPSMDYEYEYLDPGKPPELTGVNPMDYQEFINYMSQFENWGPGSLSPGSRVSGPSVEALRAIEERRNQPIGTNDLSGRVYPGSYGSKSILDELKTIDLSEIPGWIQQWKNSKRNSSKGSGLPTFNNESDRKAFQKYFAGKSKKQMMDEYGLTEREYNDFIKDIPKPQSQQQTNFSTDPKYLGKAYADSFGGTRDRYKQPTQNGQGDSVSSEELQDIADQNTKSPDAPVTQSSSGSSGSPGSPSSSGGKTVSQLWTEKTGLPWSEAAKRGYTTTGKDNYNANMALRERLMSGEFDNFGQETNSTTSGTSTESTDNQTTNKGKVKEETQQETKPGVNNDASPPNGYGAPYLQRAKFDYRMSPFRRYGKLKSAEFNFGRQDEVIPGQMLRDDQPAVQIERTQAADVMDGLKSRKAQRQMKRAARRGDSKYPLSADDIMNQLPDRYMDTGGEPPTRNEIAALWNRIYFDGTETERMYPELTNEQLGAWNRAYFEGTESGTPLTGSELRTALYNAVPWARYVNDELNMKQKDAMMSAFSGFSPVSPGASPGNPFPTKIDHIDPIDPSTIPVLRPVATPGFSTEDPTVRYMNARAQTVPHKKKSGGSPYISGYEQGGEYYLDDNMIKAILANGGEIEYLD